MGDVIHANFTPKTTDGGKARILAHRYAINLAEPVFDWRFDDLTMDHADPQGLRPGDVIVTEWDDSSGVPVKISRTIEREIADPCNMPSDSAYPGWP